MNRTDATQYALRAVGVAVVAGVVLFHTGLLPVGGAVDPDRGLGVTDCDDTEKGSLTVGVAETFTERYVGLSRTDSLGTGEGLVLAYDEPGSKGIAMRNMDFALDVLFVSEDGEITRIETLDAPDSAVEYYLTYESASGPGRFVVETNAGWADERGISPGDCVRGLPA
ncbi:DUF192 domain-containing protein [Halorussus salilacus]|uniref:DUF192 domain-containing protein n=1 Tax=Halorussus salilacus TaxID=2953750 RepID=UPI0020A04E14|nr:DUF192 domain-containing protein [Halorussus salilacus]USZ69262.1 DUF192 domain-containing protein [Halorussus salilacus]